MEFLDIKNIYVHTRPICFWLKTLHLLFGIF